MICRACAKDDDFLDGRCGGCGAATPAADAAPAPVCAKCGAAMAAGEGFCAACGHRLRSLPQSLAAVRRNQQTEKKIRDGRSWILIVAVLTALGAVIFYAAGRAEVEKTIRDAERELSLLTPEERDEHFLAQTEMTWQQAIDQDRGAVTLLLVINLALAATYFGLWIWAKRNPFAAAMVALLIYVTVIVVSAVIEPKTLAQGLILKPLVIIALMSAARSAYLQRKLAAA